MTMELFFVFLFWLLLCHLIGKVEEGRNIDDGGTFFFSFILSPLIGIIFAALSEKKVLPMNKNIKFIMEPVRWKRLKVISLKQLMGIRMRHTKKTDNQPLSPVHKTFREEKYAETKQRCMSWKDHCRFKPQNPSGLMLSVYET